MEILVTYDVDTTTRDGQRRLRQVAKACEGIGYRVQKSVFEVLCTPVQRLRLEAQLLDIIDTNQDSIRIYPLNSGSFSAARHLGSTVSPTHQGPIIV